MLGTSLIAADGVVYLCYVVARLGLYYRAVYSKDDKGKGKEVTCNNLQKDTNKEKDKDVVTISSKEED